METITKPETSRTKGMDAHNFNILAAKLLSDTVRTTLGPKGMDKLIVDKEGNAIVTNDGATILREINIENPTAKMIAEVSLIQENEVGDGTTTAVILAGELLKKAGKMIEQGIHPTIIIQGYKIALEKTLYILNNIAKTIKNREKAFFEISRTAMTGKGVEDSKDFLSKLLLNAIKRLDSPDKDSINFLAIPGAHVLNSELINGIAIEKDKVQSQTSNHILNPKIALITEPIEVKEIETQSKITINSTEEMQAFLDMEEKSIESMLKKIYDSKANVIFCQKGIDDNAINKLAEKDIICFRRITNKELNRIAKATGGRLISKIDELTSEDLGKAKSLEIKKFSGQTITIINGCTNPKALTIILRGSTSHVVSETKRAMEDAFGDVLSALEDKKIVGGAGSSEIEVYLKLLEFSKSLSGKEQLAVNGFASAMQIIPETLAENAGLDKIELVTKLISSHNKDEIYNGINVFSGKIFNTLNSGVIEPLKIKTQAITSATEVAIMILRIDDIIISEKKTN